MAMDEKRKWIQIQISYDDGTNEYIDSRTFDEIWKLIPLIEGLNQAKNLKEKLERILK